MAKASLKVTGLEAAVANIRDLTPAVQRSVLRPSARAGTKAPRQALKRVSPRRSGALRKAMASKISTNKTKGSVTGTVGPNRKYAVMTKGKRGRHVSGIKQVAKHAASAEAVTDIRPSRYAHVAGRGRTADYMAQVQQATQAQSLADFTERSKLEMAKVAARMAAKKKK